MRDSDGFEAYRASVWHGQKSGLITRSGLTSSYLRWFIYWSPSPNEVDLLIDAVESSFAKIPEDVLRCEPNANSHQSGRGLPTHFGVTDWRMSNTNYMAWMNLLRDQRRFRRHLWTRDQTRRYWGLLRWFCQPNEKATRRHALLDELLDAYEVGAATPADVYDHLVGDRTSGYNGHRSFESLQRVSNRKYGPEMAKHPWLEPYVNACRKRIVELECKRGELPGPSSYAANSLSWTGGLDALVMIVSSLFGANLDRSNSWMRGVGRAESLSQLLQKTEPMPEDTPQQFAQAMRAHGVSDKRLVEIGMFAPQWSRHVEEALGWPGFEEAVWWMHAHTKEHHKPDLARWTPLEAQELRDGAVDVEWFKRVHAMLDPKQWKMLDEAAKYTSSGTGHVRAQQFADAMLSKLSEETLVKRIEDKRHQDSVRTLGLIPIDAETDEDRKAILLRRYKTLQEFIRGSRKFGAQRQSSEKLAATIGLQNLARTAGYPDPVRLEWAMEREAVAELASGPVEVTSGDVTVRLSIDDFGAPDLVAFKAGKLLKAIPPAAKKAPEVAALSTRKTEIARQGSRVRLSLEGAMCRGDQFLASEIRDLMTHPVLRPMLRSLVLIDDSTHAIGYPVQGDENALIDWQDGVHLLSSDAKLRIAHPHDLFLSGAWDKWQWDCFARERIQPFKQIFRELYLLTSAEKENGVQSARYSGHQINRKQAMAILGKRGWVGSPEEGDITRTFHAEGVSASLGFDYGYTTPSEVEGMTIDTISFAKRGKFEMLQLESVPPRVFSEAMRDLDLIVSVCHQGGVDPEASASTVEMRAALVRDACRLLKLDNVRMLPSHVMVDGKLGTYSIHLGSGTVHKQPGGHLCIVPVHSQHRGRIFLPFADDDPRTAEVLSKVVLLARDSEIKDPIILEQIYAGAS